MESSNRKNHWDKVYRTKSPDQVSWTQVVPQTSLDLFQSFGLDSEAKIIDIGGGDSKLVDYLLDLGFKNITVLDISEAALEKAKTRLAERGKMVNWIVSDIMDFEATETYDIWHDRATFHFLTTENQISRYLAIAKKSVAGFLTIGTFSETGPMKCSGLEIKQYSEDSLAKELENGFKKIRCIYENHITPFGTNQNFLFCSFSRKYS